MIKKFLRTSTINHTSTITSPKAKRTRKEHRKNHAIDKW